jgi:hypothetical protein
LPETAKEHGAHLSGLTPPGALNLVRLFDEIVNEAIETEIGAPKESRPGLNADPHDGAHDEIRISGDKETRSAIVAAVAHLARKGFPPALFRNRARQTQQAHEASEAEGGVGAVGVEVDDDTGYHIDSRVCPRAEKRNQKSMRQEEEYEQGEERPDDDTHFPLAFALRASRRLSPDVAVVVVHSCGRRRAGQK